MMKRVEFVLNLDDPHEAAIYRALLPSLRRRRAGSVIRQALEAFLLGGERRVPLTRGGGSMVEAPLPKSNERLDEHLTDRIVEQSANMFGF